MTSRAAAYSNLSREPHSGTTGLFHPRREGETGQTDQATMYFYVLEGVDIDGNETIMRTIYYAEHFVSAYMEMGFVSE